MLMFILRRLGVMLLTAFALTFIVFSLTNLQPNLEKLAKSEASVRMTDDQVVSWIANNGFDTPMISRYGQWLGLVPGWVKTMEDGEVRAVEQHPGVGPVAQAGEELQQVERPHVGAPGRVLGEHLESGDGAQSRHTFCHGGGLRVGQDRRQEQHLSTVAPAEVPEPRVATHPRRS